MRDENGVPFEMVTVMRDVTRRKAMETELANARVAADAAASAKSDFLANMSHELRTPLTGVIGFSNLLSELPGLPSEAQMFVDRISTGSQALLSVINDILEFSKLDAGHLKLELQPFALSEFVRSTAELVSIQARAKGLALEVVCTPEAPEWVQGDAARLRQILLNLLNNAVKFTAEGQVTLRLAYGASGAAGQMRIEVEDTGPGIAPEMQARLFQRFSQVDGSISRNFGGTGLGLSICKGLVELMGGTIGLVSLQGVGSVFWFEAPAPVAQAPNGPIELAPVVEGRQARILVVDDVAVNRELVRILLTPFGHVVDEAPGGAEAVEACLRSVYDLIFMDVHTPGVDGLAATRSIRAGCLPNASTPIIALTALAGEDRLAACFDAGMDDYTPKPFSLVELLTKVAEWTAAREGNDPTQVLSTAVE